MDLDKKKIAEELGISGEMYNELLRDFTSQAETVLPQLQAAVKVKDFQQITERGHFIKGSAGNLKIHELYLIAKEIEAGGKEGKDMETIRTHVESFKSLLEELKKLI
ncbi:MAG: Hpt domain-containing protein [Candidatus Omnitrophota bacterium]